MSATRALNIGVISFDHGHQNGYVSAMLELPSANLVAAADSVSRNSSTACTLCLQRIPKRRM